MVGRFGQPYIGQAVGGELDFMAQQEARSSVPPFSIFHFFLSLVSFVQFSYSTLRLSS
jgi:hypothetical protein